MLIVICSGERRQYLQSDIFGSRPVHGSDGQKTRRRQAGGPRAAVRSIREVHSEPDSRRVRFSYLTGFQVCKAVPNSKILQFQNDPVYSNDAGLRLCGHPAGNPRQRPATVRIPGKPETIGPQQVYQLGSEEVCYSNTKARGCCSPHLLSFKYFTFQSKC